MKAIQTNQWTKHSSKRLGMAAFAFFFAKGLAWIAAAIGGYAALGH
ncbi:MAG TPA: hypothetical protein VJZ71_17795 [Phycisphaerae bacterium]|nr:hypothetical protein [Phycisphaerae bacterium]